MDRAGANNFGAYKFMNNIEKEEKEKLKQILYEITYQINESAGGLPKNWLYNLQREIEEL